MCDRSIKKKCIKSCMMISLRYVNSILDGV